MFGKNKNLIMIMDGNFFCYKSYYGYPDLYLADRETHIGVVYGFIKQVRHLHRKYSPKKIIVAWDSETNIRKDIFPEYKSNRRYNEKFDKESFHQQIKILKDVLHDMGISQIYRDGYEADDVMAEFCRRILKNRTDLNFIVVTNDHDLFQIINKNISILSPLKEGWKLYTESVFKKEYEITPKQYLQSMYLSGCKTDKVPGIDGIGQKKAINIIKSIGDISNLQSADKISGIGDKKLELIKSSTDKIEFAKKLVTIFTGFKIKLEKGEKNLKAVREIFENYFRFESFLMDWEEFKEMCS